ncbi:hypothetical protein ACN28S_58065 [Cystobacter fuscus]
MASTEGLTTLTTKNLVQAMIGAITPNFRRVTSFLNGMTRMTERNYKSKSDGLWWSADNTGHGGSKWKVFEETGDGLKWKADADEFGDFIRGKHKGPTGKFIPWSELSGR